MQVELVSKLLLLFLEKLKLLIPTSLRFLWDLLTLLLSPTMEIYIPSEMVNMVPSELEIKTSNTNLPSLSSSMKKTSRLRMLLPERATLLPSLKTVKFTHGVMVANLLLALT